MVTTLTKAEIESGSSCSSFAQAKALKIDSRGVKLLQTCLLFEHMKFCFIRLKFGLKMQGKNTLPAISAVRTEGIVWLFGCTGSLVLGWQLCSVTSRLWGDLLHVIWTRSFSCNPTEKGTCPVSGFLKAAHGSMFRWRFMAWGVLSPAQAACPH